MKSSIALIAVMVLSSGYVFAGQDYDACRKQEQELRAKESNQCSGLQYLLNPSGCFATKKVLKEFDEGKCARILRTENVAPATSEPNRESGPAPTRTTSIQKISPQQEKPVNQSSPVPPVIPQTNNVSGDACRKQEQELRVKEGDLCSGIKYLLNPSACFAAKKQLKEFDEGKCNKIEPAIQTHPNQQSSQPPPVTPQRRSPVEAPTVRIQTSPGGGQRLPNESEQLKEENIRIKAENERLRLELEQLRKNLNK